ncbi:hypothetical protein [Sediminitomix flava]|uniref:Uncharacterized protein n=1 Tax=Sediminitomix flava TaxID=379075 RepID=A0A315ZHQ7_SEDFL|nr:hypothetical protein [Sediminitomix flava]PWJ44244.1 hypothetical protein BC781_101594 [Sediminitomix flava]
MKIQYILFLILLTLATIFGCQDSKLERQYNCHWYIEGDTLYYIFKHYTNGKKEIYFDVNQDFVYDEYSQLDTMLNSIDNGFYFHSWLIKKIEKPEHSYTTFIRYLDDSCQVNFDTLILDYKVGALDVDSCYVYSIDVNDTINDYLFNKLVVYIDFTRELIVKAEHKRDQSLLFIVKDEIK